MHGGPWRESRRLKACSDRSRTHTGSRKDLSMVETYPKKPSVHQALRLGKPEQKIAANQKHYVIRIQSLRHRKHGLEMAACVRLPDETLFCWTLGYAA